MTRNAYKRCIQKRKMLCSQYGPIHSVILTLTKNNWSEEIVDFFATKIRMNNKQIV